MQAAFIFFLSPDYRSGTPLVIEKKGGGGGIGHPRGNFYRSELEKKKNRSFFSLLLICASKCVVGFFFGLMEEQSSEPAELLYFNRTMKRRMDLLTVFAVALPEVDSKWCRVCIVAKCRGSEQLFFFSLSSLASIGPAFVFFNDL